MFGKLRGSLLIGLILVFLGVFLILGQILRVDIGKYLGPLVLILIGVFILLGRRRSSKGPVITKEWGTMVVEGGSAGQLSSFNRVHHRGVGEVIITQGEPQSVKIEAEEQVQKWIRLEVKDETLIIRLDADWTDWVRMPWSSTGPIRFYITMKEVRGLHLAGAGSVKARGVQTAQLEVNQSGAGNLNLEGLQVEKLRVNLSGAGSITTDGNVQSQEILLSGAGSYHADTLQSQNTIITLKGVGSAYVCVAQTLNAEISGIGSVRYRGSPQVIQKVTGLGSLKQES